MLLDDPCCLSGNLQQISTLFMSRLARQLTTQKVHLLCHCWPGEAQKVHVLCQCWCGKALNKKRYTFCVIAGPARHNKNTLFMSLLVLRSTNTSTLWVTNIPHKPKERMIQIMTQAPCTNQTIRNAFRHGMHDQAWALRLSIHAAKPCCHTPTVCTSFATSCH